MKGKGEVLTYWLTGATEGAVQCREVRETDQVPQFTGVFLCHILVGCTASEDLLYSKGFIFLLGTTCTSTSLLEILLIIWILALTVAIMGLFSGINC